MIRNILSVKIGASEPARELSQTQLEFVHDYLVKVLGVEKGIEASFEEFSLSMEREGVVNFTQIILWLRSLVESDLFDQEGNLTEKSS